MEIWVQEGQGRLLTLLALSLLANLIYDFNSEQNVLVLVLIFVLFIFLPLRRLRLLRNWLPVSGL